jgi:hypothetical protein
MKVSILCVADRPMRLPLLVWSLMAQTHTDWELLILDQSERGYAAWYLGALLEQESRIKTVFVTRRGDWGYVEKLAAARELATGDVLMFPQDDAYYTPNALAEFVSALERGADLALCGWLYDLFGYQPMPPCPNVGRVDVGGFMVRRSTFLEHGWPDGDAQTMDGRFIERLVASGVRWESCPGILYVRN